MKHWLNDGFSESLWERDIASLAPDHQGLAQRVFLYAVDSLGSEPFQRESSRTGRSDGQIIFRTKLHRSFWLVLDTKAGGLQLHFPDKEDSIQGIGAFLVEKAPGTQWSRKKEKRVRIPHSFEPEHTTTCIQLVDQIHAAAIDYYSRGKDFSLTLRTLMGEPQGGTALTVPEAEEFRRLLAHDPRCKACGSRNRLNVCRAEAEWELYCDNHNPARSLWTHVGTEFIPFEVKRSVWHRDHGKCVVCGSANYATFDHMIPANRGGGNFSGSHLETNVRLKCRTCNYSKGNKPIP